MAKKTTRSSTVPAIARPVMPATPNLQGDAQINMGLKIDLTVESLVNVAIVNRRKALEVQRDAAEDAHAALNRTYDDSNKVLLDMAAKLAETFKADDNAEKLVAAIAAFTGDAHVVKLMSRNFSYNGEADPYVNIEKRKLLGKLCVMEHRADGQYKNGNVVVEKEVEIVFTAEMIEQITVIEKNAEAVRDAADKLTKIRQELARLPQLRADVEAQITTAYLRGELTDGNALIESLLNESVKQLPA